MEYAEGPLIETITLRQTYNFYQWKRIRLYFGFNIFHVLGLQYESSKFRDAPEGYYPIGSIRGLLYLGISVATDKNEKRSFYFESGMNDIWIENTLSNSTVNPTEHISLAIGLKQKF